MAPFLISERPLFHKYSRRQIRPKQVLGLKLSFLSRWSSLFSKFDKAKDINVVWILNESALATGVRQPAIVAWFRNSNAPSTLTRRRPFFFAAQRGRFGKISMQKTTQETFFLQME